MDEQVKWGDVIAPEHALFKVNHSRDQLEQQIVHIPVFSDTEMLGLQYAEAKKDGSFVYYDTYCNYVGFTIEYKRANLAKFVHQFGVQVLKKSEEKYTQPLILHSVEYHFMYDYEEERWKYVETGSVEHFNERREYIEELRKDSSVKRIIQTYFTHRKSVKHSATSMLLNHNVSYRNLLHQWNALIQSASEFHQMKHFFGELSEKNALLIEEKLLELRKKHMELLRKANQWRLLDHTRSKDVTNPDEHQLITLLSTLLVDIKNVLYTPGYWVFCKEVYPNACEIYNALQIAESNRNAQTKAAIKAKLISVSKRENTHYYTVEQLSTKE